jgi:hypothetical protein
MLKTRLFNKQKKSPDDMQLIDDKFSPVLLVISDYVIYLIY